MKTVFSMKRAAVEILVRWIPLAVAITVLALTGYVMVQQVLRQSANDPQIQIANDTAAALGRGETIPTAALVAIESSLAPFTMTFDASGRVVTSQGLLGGKVPVLPGIPQRAGEHRELRFTWAPEPTVRIAAVVVAYDGSGGGFVLAGRSLKEVERRDETIAMLRVHKARQNAQRLELGPLWKDNDYVFTGPDGSPLSPDTTTHQFGRLAVRAKLPGLRFHDLRHAHATLLLASGVHAKIVSERLGHASIGITLDTYSHVLPGLQEQAAGIFDEALRKARLANG